jgi:hypothetical protein
LSGGNKAKSSAAALEGLSFSCQPDLPPSSDQSYRWRAVADQISFWDRLRP